jgi:O-antigen ligase
MIALTIFLVFFRLLFWRIFPQYGTFFVGDVVFGLFCLTGCVLWSLSKVRSPLVPYISIWLVAGTLSFLNTAKFLPSIANWFLLLTYIFCFACLVRAVKSRENTILLWGFMCLGAVIAAVIGIREYWILHWTPLPATELPMLHIIYASKRACSLQGWPTAFAGFLILFIPTGVLYFLQKKTLFRGAFLSCLLAGLYSAFSILPVVSLGLAFSFSRRRRQVLPILLVLSLFLYFAWETKSVSSFFVTRGQYYHSAWNAIVQHPFRGTGIGTYSSDYEDGTAPSVFTHNSYLQIWSESGPLGLIGVLGLLFTFWKMKPSEDLLEQSLYIGLLAVFIDNFFSFSMIKPNLSFIWWIALALYSNLQQKKAR